MSTEEREKAMEDAPRRLGDEQRISSSDRTKEALRSHWGSPDGDGEESWAQIAADFVEEAKEGRDVYGRLARKWCVAMNTAQMWVKAAVDNRLLETTGEPSSPAGRLTKQAVALLRNRET